MSTKEKSTRVELGKLQCGVRNVPSQNPGLWEVAISVLAQVSLILLAQTNPLPQEACPTPHPLRFCSSLLGAPSPSLIQQKVGTPTSSLPLHPN